MIGLGFSAYVHESAAALLVDGRTVALARESWFNRERGTTAFPERAVRFCLEQSGVTIDQVDFVSFFWDPWAGVFRRLARMLIHLPRKLAQGAGSDAQRIRNLRGVEGVFRQTFGYTGDFHFVRHPLAHAALAAFRSPFDRAAVLVVDNAGEAVTTWLGKLTDEGRLSPIREVYYPHSIGLAWNAVSEYLGFRSAEELDSVMGASACGDECLVEVFQELVDYKGEGDFELVLPYFDFHGAGKESVSKKFIDTFGPARGRNEKLSARHVTVARALQASTQDFFRRVTADLVQLAGSRNLCFAGQMALNGRINARLAGSGTIDTLFVPPDPNDGGAAEGAALYTHHRIDRHAKPVPYDTVFLGPQYESEAVKNILLRSRLPFSRLEDPAAQIAALLAEGKIVGWFQGRAEAGPFPLGNRSVLADPRSERMKARLNQKVKHRDWFHPFGTSVLAERVDEIFETGGALSPYKHLTLTARSPWREALPAILHVDFTARVHTVQRSQNPLFYSLIQRFAQRTGVPAILNTGFNLPGEPVVSTPRQAVECYRSTGMDVLVIGDFMCEKNGKSAT